MHICVNIKRKQVPSVTNRSNQKYIHNIYLESSKFQWSSNVAKALGMLFSTEKEKNKTKFGVENHFFLNFLKIFTNEESYGN